MVHWCPACAAEGRREWGAYGFAAWPGVNPAHVVAGYVWACSAHRDRLKYLDRLDAYLWAQHNAPHLLERVDWRDARAWLDAQFVVLVGVAGAV